MTVPAESDLQAHLTPLLQRAFPHISPANLTHETRLVLQFGRTPIIVDSKEQWTKEGYADIILSRDGEPIAVIELKREDKKLKQADVAQAMSYARVLKTIAPLVIVSNGKEDWFVDVFTGERLKGDHIGEEQLKELIANATAIGREKVQSAIETLLGTDSKIWMQAVQGATSNIIERLSTKGDDPRKPFGRFHVPRIAGAAPIPCFEKGAITVVIEGAPLSGKTNVLKSFFDVTRAEGVDFATLFVSAAVEGTSIFELLADVLSAELGWVIEPKDARAWLRRFADLSSGPTLVLAIDDVARGSKVAQELEAFATGGIGEGLRLLVTADKADDVLKARRNSTAIADQAKVLKLGPLNDKEFQAAQLVLWDQQISFDQGAELSAAHRVPWVLRAGVGVAPLDIPKGRQIRLPASVGVEIIGLARKRLNDLSDLRRPLRELADALLKHSAKKSAELTLGQAGAFIVPIEGMGQVGRTAMQSLTTDHWAREYRHAGGEDVVVPTAPELFMSELADVMSRGIEKRLADPVEAAAWLIDTCDGLFLGDVIGAQAIADCAIRGNAIPKDLIDVLLADEPEISEMGTGTFAMAQGDGRLLFLKVDADGSMTPSDKQGNPIGETIPPDPDQPVSYVNQTAWSILAQLTRLRMAQGEPGANQFDMKDRLDLLLMRKIGKCSHPLFHGAAEPIGFKVHGFGEHGTALAREHALAEAVTMSMRAVFSKEWTELDTFIDEIVAEDSLVLLVRTHNALHALEGSSDPGVSDWAEENLRGKLVPAIRRLLKFDAD